MWHNIFQFINEQLLLACIFIVFVIFSHKNLKHLIKAMIHSESSRISNTVLYSERINVYYLLKCICSIGISFVFLKNVKMFLSWTRFMLLYLYLKNHMIICAEYTNILFQILSLLYQEEHHYLEHYRIKCSKEYFDRAYKVLSHDTSQKDKMLNYIKSGI